MGALPHLDCVQVDMGCLTDNFRHENEEYYLHTSQWMKVHPQQMLGSPSCFKRFDLHTLKLEDLQVGLPLCSQHTALRQCRNIWAAPFVSLREEHGQVPRQLSARATGTMILEHHLARVCLCRPAEAPPRKFLDASCRRRPCGVLLRMV
jgi:hypothetical protein